MVGELSGRNTAAEPKFAVSKTVYPVVVGAGGAASTSTEQPGGDSSVFGIVSLGGGRGGRGRVTNGANGGPGGSGGGAGADEFSTRSGGAGTAGQGFNGGSSPNANLERSGGGGGAAGAGQNGVESGALGGPGLTTSITGSPMTFSAGGRGRSRTASAGGPGGANTGNGGRGGRSGPTRVAGDPGGSGIVIIRYPIGTE